MTSLCGYPFKEGERYFVYAGRRDGGKLLVSLCGPTVLLKDAAEDLEYVKDIDSGKSGTRIFGSVHQANNRNSFVPLSGIEITIKGKKNMFKTETDDNGRYVFKDIPKTFTRLRRSCQIVCVKLPRTQKIYSIAMPLFPKSDVVT
jgi:hypothetical protein